MKRISRGQTWNVFDAPSNEYRCFFRACLLQQYRHILCGPRLIKCPRLVRQIHAAQSTGQPPSLTNMIFWARERVGPETDKLTYSKGSNVFAFFWTIQPWRPNVRGQIGFSSCIFSMKKEKQKFRCTFFLFIRTNLSY